MPKTQVHEPIVYVTNDNRSNDFSKAKKYGRLMVVTVGNINVYNPNRSLITFSENLKGFTEQDYFMVSGNALSGLLALAAVFGKVRYVNLLVFDARNEDYLVHRLDLQEVRFLRTDP